MNTLTLPSSVSAAFTNLTLGIVPLSSFDNLELLNFSLAQEDGTGYSIYADITSNSISITRNNAYSHHIMKQDLSIRWNVGLLVLREVKSSM